MLSWNVSLCQHVLSAILDLFWLLSGCATFSMLAVTQGDLRWADDVNPEFTDKFK